MKLKRRVLAIFIVLVMLLPNFLTPFQNIAYATGSKSMDLVITGNGVQFKDDGSVEFWIYREKNEGHINVKVYNDHDEQCDLIDCTNDPSHAKENYEGMTQAYCTIPYDDITKCYFVITSEDILDLNLVRFYIGEDDYAINDDGKIFLTDNVLKDDFVGITFNQIRDLGAPKRVEFYGDSITIDENTITMNNPLVYTTGTVSFTVYSSNGTPLTPEFYSKDNPNFNPELPPDEKTNPYMIPDTSNAFVTLDKNTYAGSYMIVTATGMAASDMKFMFFGEELFIEPNTGKVELRDLDSCDMLRFDEWRFQYKEERKEIQISGSNVVVNGNIVTLDSPIEDNPGTISLTFFNSDGSNAIVKPYMYWDGEKDVPTGDGCTALLNTTTYEGVYATVAGSNGFDISNLKFQLDGEDYYLENNRFNFPNIDDIQLADWSIRALYEKKQISAYSDNTIAVNNNAITMDCVIPGNEGKLTFAFYNADNSPATIYRDEEWNFETNQSEPNLKTARIKLNLPTYEGAYFIVSSESNPAVDLTDIKFDFAGSEYFMDANHKVVLKEELDELYGINLDNYSIIEINTRKEIRIENVQDGINDDGTVTIPCTLENNVGTLTIGAYNSDGTQVNFRLEQEWMWDSDEPSWSATGKFKTSTFEGTYFTVTSTSNPPVDLTKVLFALGPNEYPVVNGKVYIPEMEMNMANIHEDNIRSSIKNNVTVNATVTDGNIADLFINNIPFVDYVEGPDRPIINTVNKTLPVEARQQDTIEIDLDYGYIFKSLTINGIDYDLDDYATYANLTIPHAEIYNMQIVCEKDIALPGLFWAYGDAEMFGNEVIVSHGRVNVASVTLPNGTTYPREEIELVDEPGMGMHFRHEREATLRYPFDNSLLGEQVRALPGSTVKLKIVPDEGYQVTKTKFDDFTLVPVENEKNCFTMVMPDVDPSEDLTLSDVIEPAYNDVKNLKTSEFNGLAYTVPENEREEGTLRLFLKEPDSSINKLAFANLLGDGYNIVSYFDLDLSEVYYKGNSDNVWIESQLNTINTEEKIDLNLLVNINPDDYVLIRNPRNTNTYEIVENVNYDSSEKLMTFNTNKFGNYAIATKVKSSEKLFKDVENNKWYTDSIQYVKNAGIMRGKGDGTEFGLNDPIWRGDIALMLYRLAGQPDTSSLANPFTDVPEGKYFTEAVKWAVANNITTGKTATTFDPYGNVTRQELAVFMARYAKNILGKDTSSTYDITKIADYNDVSSWARAPMQYIMEKGIITGDMKLGYARILPKDNATRAQAATMFERFLKNVVL